MPDHDKLPKSEYGSTNPERQSTARRQIPRPGTQAIAPVSPNDEPLLALPPPAYQNLLVISTRRAPGRIETALQRAGYDPARVGVVPVSTAWSEYDGPLWVTDPVGPSDLTGIAIRVSEAAQHLAPGRGWMVLDALTPLLMYSEASRVHRFINTTMRNLSARDVRGVYCLCPDALDDQTVERFRSLCDNEIDLMD